MALDFPTTVKLREEEHRVVLGHVEREPLLSRAEVVIGLFAMGARIAQEPEGFQELLGVLRRRRQGVAAIAPADSAVPKKSAASVGSPASVPGKRRGCA